jgi:hypothetical protein
VVRKNSMEYGRNLQSFRSQLQNRDRKGAARTDRTRKS